MREKPLSTTSRPTCSGAVAASRANIFGRGTMTLRTGVSVNSSRPLKPRVIVHEPKVPRDEALVLDLEQAGGLGIRRSLRPQQLPATTLAYLAPRPRVAYFFEPAHDGAVSA